jgi:preprotein translocase subunit SecE
MATTKSKGDQSLLNEMFSTTLYKRNQGRRVRQWTGVAVAAIFILGARSMYFNLLADFDALKDSARLGISIGLGLVGCWFAYRLVNYPKFADFLISVQAEMDKVTWISMNELMRSTIVVIVCMTMIGALLYVYDIFWKFLFKLCGILKL